MALVTAFEEAVDSALGSEKGLSGFILAYGQAGRGKSVAADGYHISRTTGAYVRVWQNWSQSAFLQRLLFEVRGSKEDMPRINGNRCKEIIVQLLKDRKQPLFIDEADRLKIDRIEDLRDIYEMTGVPVILIGEEGLLGLLSERRRIWSRVPTEKLLEEVRAALDRHIVINHDLLVKGPVLVPVAVSFAMEILAGDPAATVLAAENSIRAAFSGSNPAIAGLMVGQDVIRDRLAVGVITLSGVKRVAWSGDLADGDVVVPSDGLAVLESLSVTYSWVGEA